MAMGRLIQAGFLLSALLTAVAAHAAAPTDQADQAESPTGFAEPLDQAAAPPAFERSDCVLHEAVCRSECAHHGDEKRCIISRCEPQFLRCTASLPVGKVVSLPAACVPADQEAVRRLERQGELLDADSTLFAESFNALVRARIACRAGYFREALNIYDEIQESMATKRVRDDQARQQKR
jgi:hypothetical protein